MGTKTVIVILLTLTWITMMMILRTQFSISQLVVLAPIVLIGGLMAIFLVIFIFLIILDYFCKNLDFYD